MRIESCGHPSLQCISASDYVCRYGLGLSVDSRDDLISQVLISDLCQRVSEVRPRGAFRGSVSPRCVPQGCISHSSESALQITH